jgi:mRNA-degrading endonuclease toxin of MazEF toxin-antitoxin module
VTRGEVWLSESGGKRRPVLVLTRPAVIDVRTLVTVAEITTQARGLSTEVAFDHETVGLAEASVINCDGLHTIRQTMLTGIVGAVDAATMRDVCRSVGYALGC